MIRRFKPTYWLYNYFHKAALAHNIPLYKKYGIQKRYYESISAEDFKHLKGTANKYDKLDSFDTILKEENISKINSKYHNTLRNWSKNGYVILEQFFPESRIEAINTEVDFLIKKRKVKFQNKGKKIMFAFHHSSLIKAMGNDEHLQIVLKLLMGKKMELFQSINFMKGSEQPTHSDSIHMTTFPLGNLIATWVALEDVSLDNGPLHYYPSSHKLPYLMNEDFDNQGSRFFLGNKTYRTYEQRITEIIKEEELEQSVFLAKKGDVFIWHANLLHGGNEMNKPELTRKSVVFHYYSNDAICYHELTQRPSLRVRF